MNCKGVIVGPSECDVDRKTREKEICEVWNELTNKESFVKAHFIFGLALDLFREALSCYQNGAYMATVLMCRSVTEIIVYLIASRNIKESLKNGIGEIEVNFEMYSAQYGEFLKEAKKRLPAVKNIEEDINCIREKGNFVAHYGQRLDKEFDEKDVKSDFRKVDLWITKEDALEVLKKTVLVFTKISSEVL